MELSVLCWFPCGSPVTPRPNPEDFTAHKGRWAGPGHTCQAAAAANLPQLLQHHLHVGLPGLWLGSWAVTLTSRALPSTPWNPGRQQVPPQGHFFPCSVTGIGSVPRLFPGLLGATCRPGPVRVARLSAAVMSPRPPAPPGACGGLGPLWSPAPGDCSSLGQHGGVY